MGHGHYSLAAHAKLIGDRAYKTGTEVFSQTQCHPLMNPKGLKVRECRDSADHPESLGIAFALDVTGSMGDIPQLLAKKELPNFMKLLAACGVALRPNALELCYAPGWVEVHAALHWIRNIF